MEPPAKRKKSAISSTNGARAIDNSRSASLRQPVRVTTAARSGTEIRPPTSRNRVRHALESDTNSIATGSEADDEETAALRRRRLREFCYDSGVGELSERAKTLREERLKQRRERRKQQRQSPASGSDHAAAPKKKATARGLQLRVVGGRIHVQQDSLVVRPETEGLELDENVEEVEEGDRHVTSASFSRHSRTDRWSIAATEAFYRLKNKFKKEIDRHPELVDAALRCPLPIEVEHMQRGIEDHNQRKKEEEAKKRGSDSDSDVEGEGEEPGGEDNGSARRSAEAASRTAPESSHPPGTSDAAASQTAGVDASSGAPAAGASARTPASSRAAEEPAQQKEGSTAPGKSAEHSENEGEEDDDEDGEEGEEDEEEEEEEEEDELAIAVRQQKAEALEDDEDM